LGFFAVKFRTVFKLLVSFCALWLVIVERWEYYVEQCLFRFKNDKLLIPLWLILRQLNLVIIKLKSGFFLHGIRKI